jgi:hypothetical protein
MAAPSGGTFELSFPTPAADFAPGLLHAGVAVAEDLLGPRLPMGLHDRAHEGGVGRLDRREVRARADEAEGVARPVLL